MKTKDCYVNFASLCSYESVPTKHRPQKVMKRLICLLLTATVILSIVYSSNTIASAYVGNIPFIVDSANNFSLQTQAIVKNGSVTTKSGVEFVATSMGGVSVSASGNKLYVVKGGSENDQIAVLYYYSDYTDLSTRKTIFFRQKILGHANAMAIDDKFIYVTRWCTNGTNGSSIVRISRKAINELPDNAHVTSFNQVTSNNTTVCFKVPVYTSSDKSTLYTGAITAITGYKYNSKNRITRFIINYPSANTSTSRGYIIANLNSGSMYVYDNESRIIRVKNPYPNNWMGNTSPHYQDIAYWDRYGLFVSVYYNKKNADGTTESSTDNVILNYDINSSDPDADRTYSPTHSIEISRDVDEFGRELKQYEIESLSFTNMDSPDKNHQMLLSTNRRVSEQGAGCRDAIEISSDFDAYMEKVLSK